MSSRKHCDFTFALSDISQCERLISELDDYPFWAYIRHDPDDENGSDHYHFHHLDRDEYKPKKGNHLTQILISRID